MCMVIGLTSALDSMVQQESSKGAGMPFVSTAVQSRGRPSGSDSGQFGIHSGTPIAILAREQVISGLCSPLCFIMASFNHPGAIKTTWGRVAEEMDDVTWELLNEPGVGIGDEGLGLLLKMTRLDDLGLAQLCLPVVGKLLSVRFTRLEMVPPHKSIRALFRLTPAATDAQGIAVLDTGEAFHRPVVMPKEAKPKRKAAEKGEAKAKGSKSKAKGGPKRALSAYMFFSQDWRERIKTENPDAGFGEVGKLLGAKWKELSDDERKPYVEMAAKDKARAEEEKASLATGGKSGKESCGEDVGDEDDEVSAYEQRHSHSIPAPLDPDSDPEFNAGTFVYEKKTKKRGRKSANDSESDVPLSRRNSRRRGGVVQSDVGSSSGYLISCRAEPIDEWHTEQRSRERNAAKGNPLLEYFASEEDEQDVEVTEDHVDDEAVLTAPSSGGPSMDDSETESESDEESTARPGKRKSPFPLQALPPAKRVKTPRDDSETESESEAEPVQASPAKDGEDFLSTLTFQSFYARILSFIADDSETESEDEADLVAIPVRTKYHWVPSYSPKGLWFPQPSILICASINGMVVRFFWELYDQGRGGLLGDDMGLGELPWQGASIHGQRSSFKGKTIQVISFLSAIMKKYGDTRDIDRRRKHVSQLQDRPEWAERRTLPPADATWPTCLIIAPSSVVPNWELGILRGWGVHGIPERGCPRRLQDGRLDVVVVITSFDLARRDITLLEDLAWSTIIVDEVHRVKNPRSKITEAYNRFALSCGRSSTGRIPASWGRGKQWKGYVVKPLTIGQSMKATEEERTKALAVAMIVRDKLLPKFFKRRRLPTRIDEVVFCPLTPTQINVYKRILSIGPVQNLMRKDEQCECGSRKKMKTVRHRELAEYVFAGEPIPKYGTAIMQPQYCGKWAVLDMLLRDWRKDRSNKVLLFTKSVKLLEMLEFHLGKNGYGFLKLDGSTKQADRMPMIDEFHRNPDGPVLNLTGANKVVIFDPNWNPAHDLQAMDRAYRFGQRRDVSVYRLLGAGSIEELIYARQVYKQQQMAIGYQASIQTRYFDGVQGDTSRQGELFGIKNIFKLHEDTLATKVATDLRGLSALLFDDEPPDPRRRERRPEKLSVKLARAVSRKNVRVMRFGTEIRCEETQAGWESEPASRSKTPEEQWPPKRKHHKAPASPQTLLVSRQRALIELGMIQSPAHLPTFAQSFGRMSGEEQQEVIAKLDEQAGSFIVYLVLVYCTVSGCSVLLQEGNATMVQQTAFLSGYPILLDDMGEETMYHVITVPCSPCPRRDEGPSKSTAKLLEESIPSEQPLMSEPAPISTLRAEYENGSSSFVAQIDDRSSRFYQYNSNQSSSALAFAYIEQLIRAEEPELAVVTALSGLESQKEKLMKDAGFQEIVYDLPYGVFTDLIKRIISQSGDLLTSAGLLETFQDSEGTQTPQYIVMYLRLLTSAQIRTAPEEFEEFIMHPDTGMKMTVRIHIAYLDGHSPDGKVKFVEFDQAPDSRSEPLLLLYRLANSSPLRAFHRYDFVGGEEFLISLFLNHWKTQCEQHIRCFLRSALADVEVGRLIPPYLSLLMQVVPRALSQVWYAGLMVASARSHQGSFPRNLGIMKRWQLYADVTDPSSKLEPAGVSRALVTSHQYQPDDPIFLDFPLVMQPIVIEVHGSALAEAGKSFNLVLK
ncbi:hypothetical protein BKA82DRAFT_4017843 [Pisolithus tinctorius]|nr:hypothetical protein BKA82DRAFT_4017843 [Pisolithus tinctorius]